MGSKLGIILSLFFAIFVFIFSADLITLQANYSNLETMANTVGEMFSKEGGAAFRKINEYLKHQKGVELVLENTTFKYGEFKDFALTKHYVGVLIFNEPIKISVKRTVLLGQYEGIY